MSDDSTPVEVDVNDDLNAFEAEFYGKAKPEEEVVEAEDVEDVDPDTPEAEEVDEPETDEEEAEEEVDEPEPEPEPKRKTAKDRINELVAERKAAEAREAEALRRIADMEARLARIESPSKEEEAPVAEAPKQDDAPDPDATDDKGELLYPLGEFDPKYVADLTRYTIRKEHEAAKAEEARQAEEAKAKEAQKRLVDDYEAKLSETEKELPDLREKLTVLEETFSDLDESYGMYLAETIMQMERGPEVLYYLANNVDEAQKIVASGAIAATIALGRLEGRLPTKEAKEGNKKKVSTAPEPPATTRGVGAKLTVAGDTDDLDAFEKEFFRKRR